MKNIKKNLLDLEYNKTVQFYNTAIIILFTFIIGVTVAFITRQIDYSDTIQMTFTGSVIIIVLCTLSIVMLMFRKRMNTIVEQIEKLGNRR